MMPEIGNIDALQLLAWRRMQFIRRSIHEC
jgi:hypothetical protein